MITIYTYKKCGTCLKAVKYLRQLGLDFTEKPIRETPPSIDELNKMLNTYDGAVKSLFNVSGRDYREQNIKETLPTLSKEEVVELLNGNGNLIKRPFLLAPKGNLVGFKLEEWDTCLS